jgi:methylated-DNA-[protein]-cysteine S-methyltransferase
MQFTTFKTSIGTMGLVWEGTLFTRVLLPEASAKDLKAKLKNSGALEADELPPFVISTVKKITRHLSNGREDLSALISNLDLGKTPNFHKKVYKALATVPAGKVVTYKSLAERVKSPLAMRAVGQAMAKNRFPLLIPCHRVVQTSGALGNFSAYRGVELKAELLQLEGAAAGSV